MGRVTGLFGGEPRDFAVHMFAALDAASAEVSAAVIDPAEGLLMGAREASRAEQALPDRVVEVGERIDIGVRSAVGCHCNQR